MPLVPLVENITITVMAESGALQFHIKVRSQYFDADYSFPQLNVKCYFVFTGGCCMLK